MLSTSGNLVETCCIKASYSQTTEGDSDPEPPLVYGAGGAQIFAVETGTIFLTHSNRATQQSRGRGPGEGTLLSRFI